VSYAEGVYSAKPELSLDVLFFPEEGQAVNVRIVSNNHRLELHRNDEIEQ
jgi:hypothetical protein